MLPTNDVNPDIFPNSDSSNHSDITFKTDMKITDTPSPTRSLPKKTTCKILLLDLT